ncbi:unnamed protein product, partial [Laminaria digitata]
AYGLAGRWEDALDLLPRAAAAGVAPDERMYCAVINAMGESSAWERAVELVQSMRLTCGAGGDSELEPGQLLLLEAPLPGRPAYGCACRACAGQGEWAAVLGLIGDMREDGVARDVAVYASAMRALVEAGEWERAVEVVTVEMELDGVSPDALSYHQALRACRKGASGDGRAARQALALLGEMRGKGLEEGSVALEDAARACLADGQFDLGLEVISKALEPWPRGISSDQTRPGGEKDADGQQQQQQQQQQQRWTVADVQRLETMQIALLGRAGRWEESLSVLDAMRTKYGDEELDESRAFVSAAYACASAGKWSVIQVLQSEAAEASSSSSSSSNGIVPLLSPGSMWNMRRALLSGLATAGLWRLAVIEVRSMH